MISASVGRHPGVAMSISGDGEMSSMTAAAAVIRLETQRATGGHCTARRTPRLLPKLAATRR